MNALLLLPILIPFLIAALSLLAWNRPSIQHALALGGALGMFLASVALLFVVWDTGIQVIQVGDWPAPFGITFVADTFSTIMVVLGAIVAVAAVVYSLATIERDREQFGYYPLLLFLMMGIAGAFLAGDIFNLYVWFEVMLMTSFVLLALGGEPAQLEGSLKYVTINLVSSAIFLIAVAILYSITGTLNIADLAIQLREVQQPGLVTVVSMLFVVAFGIKAAIFPLFFWLPASYPTAPAAVTALFAGLLTKVGVYALVRVFTLLFVHDVAYTHTILLGLAGFTMVTGVLGAAAQNEMRRILSFHIVSQIGYMIMGLAIFTPLAITGTVFYIIHHIIVKANLFLISGVVYRLRGSYELRSLGGLYRSHIGLGILFLIPAMSLAGIPPLSGFWAKFTLIRASFEDNEFMIALVAIVVSLLTLFSMTKIWAEVFWKPAPADTTTVRLPTTRGRMRMIAPIVWLALLTILIGLISEPVFVLSARAAEELLEPSQYIQAVLGATP